MCYGMYLLNCRHCILPVRFNARAALDRRILANLARGVKQACVAAIRLLMLLLSFDGNKVITFPSQFHYNRDPVQSSM